MADKIILESFPFDSMLVQSDDLREMVDDRLYEAEIFRKYFAKFLSNGVYYGHYKNLGENSMKVVSDGGMNIKVMPGAGIIEGADFENEEERIITLSRPISGNRKDRVVVRFDKSLSERDTSLYIKEGTGETPAELQRDDNVYEICIAEVLTKNANNVTDADITDTRLDNKLCGLVNSLITVDGKELYERFQEYIDEVTDNLVRKDQDIVLSGTIKDKNGKSLSTNDYTNDDKNKLNSLKNTVVENILTSSSTINALSAAMGKKLNEEKQNKITYGTSVPSGGQDGDLYDQIF